MTQKHTEVLIGVQYAAYKGTNWCTVCQHRDGCYGALCEVLDQLATD